MNSKISYFNTLIFTIVTGVISLLLLGLLFLDIGKPFLPFIVALEVGIFLIIGYCIYSIWALDKEMKDATANKRFVVKFDTCPDYYVKRNINGSTYCSNDYTGLNENGDKNVIKILPTEIKGSAVSMPEKLVLSSNVLPSDSLVDKFDLYALDKDNNLKDTQAKCNLIHSTPANTDPKHSIYPSLPWTYAKSRCESII